MAAAREERNTQEAQEQLGHPPATIRLAQKYELARPEFTPGCGNATVAEQHLQNALAPVARLYHDILAIIFKHLRDINPPERHHTYDRHFNRCEITPRFGWVTVTYVCRRWRQVALEWATLWTDIDLTTLGRNWAAVFAARAQHMPITISHRNALNHFYRDWIIRFLDENMWRTQSLSIVVHQDGPLATINSYAPLLHTLNITTKYESRVPGSFLGGCAPSLRHCHFTAIVAPGMSWASPLLSHLTSLAIDNHNQTADDLLDVVEHLLELETLSVVIYPHLPPPPPPRRRGVVTPPRLMELKIADHVPTTPTLAQFLSHLSLGPHCFVRCQIWTYAIDPDHPADYLDEVFPAALASVRSHADSASGTRNAITSLSLDRSCPEHLSINSLTITPQRHCEITPHLIFEFPHSSMSVYSLLSSNIVPKALKTFSSTHLQELAIWMPPIYVPNAHTLADLMGCAPGLRRLTVRSAKVVASLGTAMYPVDAAPVHVPLGRAPRLRRLTVRIAKAVASLCTAVFPVDIAPAHVPRSPAPRLQYILPRLSTLVLAEVRLGVDIVGGGRERDDEWVAKEGDSDDEQVTDDGDDERVAGELPLCLVARAQSGYPLEEMDVTQCDVDEAWVARVREALPGTRVKWNEGAQDGGKAGPAGT
ncbi:hypothetical protein FA95DRAFT_1407514 [Auriscalpium vulgare]|uniref:Uncharacterized protein n=1 Tax=Auriscalpium vulgare TaxID=40419 RepID=A0ACB8RQ29_9AGAM|nr:hypothetical protein FA95DRAFT_1407514 [Auriscalpium vulgare]